MSDAEITSSQVDYAARRQERARARRASSKRRGVVVALVAAVALLALAAGAEAIVTAGRVHPRVTVAGVPVGGMTPDAAKLVLKTELAKRAQDPVIVSHGEDSWTVKAEDVDLAFDHETEVAAAMAIGREERVFDALRSRLSAWVTGADIPASPQADPEKLTQVLDKIAKKTDVAPVDATVKIKGTEPRVVDGKDGRELDRARVVSLVLVSFTHEGTRTVEAPVPVARMKVTAASAAQAAEVAKAMLSAPVTVTHSDKKWEFTPQQAAKWIRFRSDVTSATPPGAGKLEAYVSEKAAAKPITSALGEKVGRPAKDARFKTANGRVTIIPSQDGIGPNVEALALSLTQEMQDPSADRVVELRTQRTKPAITTKKAKSMGIKERIGTYTTTYESGNLPRVNNIHLLGDALDGALIAPGGTFSFNGQAGERTAEKGYQEANAIVNGKLVPQLGGGVCQVGTTVFNAVFESGLPVVQRRNHSFYISHYPKGRDATVSWGGPDLKFKNDTDNWVLVSVSYTNSSITVSLYGTDPGYEVTSETGEWTGEKPYPTEVIKDPEMPKGSRVVEDAGITGRSIVVKRTVSKDGKVIRTDTFTSKYAPKAQVIRVGTKKTEEPAEPPAEGAGQ